MTRTFIPIAAGERFAGAILTQDGANQVNATRSAITREHPARQTLGERLAKRLTSKEVLILRFEIQQLIESDKSIYPWLK